MQTVTSASPFTLPYFFQSFPTILSTTTTTTTTTTTAANFLTPHVVHTQNFSSYIKWTFWRPYKTVVMNLGVSLRSLSCCDVHELRSTLFFCTIVRAKSIYFKQSYGTSSLRLSVSPIMQTSPFLCTQQVEDEGNCDKDSGLRQGGKKWWGGKRRKLEGREKERTISLLRWDDITLQMVRQQTATPGRLTLRKHNKSFLYIKESVWILNLHQGIIFQSFLILQKDSLLLLIAFWL